MSQTPEIPQRSQNPASVCAGAIRCPSCHKHYRWNARFAGRTVRCTCSTLLVMPTEEPTPVAAAPKTPASADKELPLGGLLATAISGSKSAVVKALEERVDEYQPSKARNQFVPMGMLLVGIPASYVLWFMLGRSVLGPIIGASANQIAQLGLYLPLGFSTVLLTTRLFGVEFDELKLTLFKLAALTLGAMAVADGLYLWIILYAEFDFRSMLIGFVIELAICALPVWYLFELEFNETILFSLVMAMPRVLLLYLLSQTIHDIWLS
jgi:hypothetical protein